MGFRIYIYRPYSIFGQSIMSGHAMAVQTLFNIGVSMVRPTGRNLIMTPALLKRRSVQVDMVLVTWPIATDVGNETGVQPGLRYARH